MHLFSYVLYSLYSDDCSKMAVTDNRSCFNELTLSGFNCCCLTVNEQKYGLFGIVCSDSESDNEWSYWNHI